MTSSTPTLETGSHGTRRWTFKGRPHRTDGPAIEHADGIKVWFLNGQRHRIDGPAVEWANGYKAWYLRGEAHRADGPAVEYAVEYADGDKEWWINGEEIHVPYSHVLTAAFNRGLPISEEAMLKIVALSKSQTNSEQIGGLKTILNKYWPSHVHKILATLFSSSDPAIKHLAFALLGRQEQPNSLSSVTSL